MFVTAQLLSYKTFSQELASTEHKLQIHFSSCLQLPVMLILSALNLSDITPEFHADAVTVNLNISAQIFLA
jgi:hypothetical protein